MEKSAVKKSAVSETGHVKNLENFNTVVTVAVSIGKTFNPSRQELSVAEMQKKYIICKSAINDVASAKAVYKTVLDARNTAFASLGAFTTRIINSLKASATTDHMDKSAREIVRKIQGTRATPKKIEEELSSSEISASHMSYDNRASNFHELVLFLEAIPQYKPNEKELQVESLKLLSDDLRARNAAVVTAMTALNNARAARNELMYKPVTGIVDVALDVKSYLKSIFGTSSQQFKKVSGLDFIKFKN